MSKGAVYVRGPDNVFYRKEKSPSVSSSSSESIGRRTSEVDKTLNELMVCGFQVETKSEPAEKKTSEPAEKKNSDHPRKGKYPPDSHPRKSPHPNPKKTIDHHSNPAHTPQSLHPYTKDWRGQVPPFLAGMLTTYLLQLGLPSIKYCMGALATLLKWTVLWCAAVGGVLLYAGAFPSMQDLQPILHKIGPGIFGNLVNVGSGNRFGESGESDMDGASEVEFRPPVPSKTSAEYAKKTSEGSKKEDASVTNVKAFQAQLRHSPRLANIENRRTEGTPTSVHSKHSHEPRVQMRRAFTEGAPADSISSSIGQSETRRRSDLGNALGTQNGVPESVRLPRTSRPSTPKIAKPRPSASNRRQSTSSLYYESNASDDDLPFLFEMKMKDSDNFSLGRSDTTTTKKSVLGTRANYSKFLANVGQ